MNTYTIQEISKMFQLSPSTLRYYEDMGLLVDVKRTGLPIAKMQEFFQYETDIPGHIDEIISLVTDHENDIQLQIKKMQEDLLHIQHKVKKTIQENLEWPDWEDPIYLL